MIWNEPDWWRDQCDCYTDNKDLTEYIMKEKEKRRRELPLPIESYDFVIVIGTWS
jgi:hypothetical protein